MDLREEGQDLETGGEGGVFERDHGLRAAGECVGDGKRHVINQRNIH